MTEEPAAEQTAASEEWTPLFDGTTTEGWHTYGSDSVGQAWTIADGALYSIRLRSRTDRAAATW